MYWDIVKARQKHEWLDYAGPKPWQKIPVYASRSGTIREISDWWWFGVHIYIVNEETTHEIVYWHLDDVYVKQWEKVEKYQKIGMMWSSWNSTAVHLHFWLRPLWQFWIDPTPYITDWEAEDQSIYLARQALKWNWDLYNYINDEEFRKILKNTNNEIRSKFWIV